MDSNFLNIEFDLHFYILQGSSSEKFKILKFKQNFYDIYDTIGDSSTDMIVNVKEIINIF